MLKDLVFNNPEYDELWLKWDGKPLILGNNDDPDGDVWTISEETVGTYTKEMMFANLTEAEKEFYNSGEFGKLLRSLLSERVGQGNPGNMKRIRSMQDTGIG